MASLPQLGLDLVTVISTQFLAFSSNSRYLVSYLGKGSVALGSAVEGLNFFFSSSYFSVCSNFSTMRSNYF